MRVAAGQRRRALVGQTAGEENPLAAPRAEGKDSTAFDEGEGQKAEEAEEFDKVGDQEVAGVEEAAPLPSRGGGLPPASPTAGGEEAPRGSADHDDERRPLV